MIVVDVWSNEEQRGSISWDGEQFLTKPDDPLLRSILQDPVWIEIGGEIVEVYAGEDPIVFILGLWKHYKSQGLRCSEAREEPDE